VGRLRKVAKFTTGEIDVEVWSDIDALKKQLARFNKKGVPRATMRALNRAAAKSKTFAGRLISKDYNIKARSINPSLKISPRASLAKSEVAIMGRGKRLSIYKHSKTKPRQGALGATFNAGGGKRVHAHTFIQRMSSGHTGVFVRTHVKGGKRTVGVSPRTGQPITKQLPIRELTYPDVAFMISDSKRGEQIFLNFVGEYPRQLFSQLDFEHQKSRGVG